MENVPVAQKPQRSPWVYALLGCGALAGLICLGFAVFTFVIGKAVKDVADGVADPAERQANAVKQLGAIPEGYNVVASLSVFGLMQTTVLTDSPMLPDGGFELGQAGRGFTYFRITGNENNKKAKGFLTGQETDAKTLAESGINIDARDIVKRGQLTIDGRKYYYVASRGQLDTGAGRGHEGLNNAILFDCPGDALHVGVWSQADPAPGEPSEKLDLAGTVADEAKLAAFLKPMSPCR